MTRRVEEAGDVSVSWVDVVACALLAVLLLLFTLLGAQGQGEGSSQALVLLAIQVRYPPSAPKPADVIAVGGKEVRIPEGRASELLSPSDTVTATVSRQESSEPDGGRVVSWQVVVVAKQEPQLAVQWRLTKGPGVPVPAEITAEVRYDSRTRTANKELGRWRPLPEASALDLRLTTTAPVHAHAGPGLAPVQPKEGRP